MDPLEQLVRRLAPELAGWKEIRGGPEWVLAFPAEPGIVFGLMLDGTASAEHGPCAATALRRGDYLLLVDPAPWRLGSGAPTPPTPFERLDASAGVVEIGSPGSVPATRIMAGHFRPSPHAFPLLRHLLPPVVHVRAGEPGAARLTRLFEQIDDEVRSERLAASFVVGRLLDVMLVEALRERTRRPEGAVGLVGGLADPRLAKAIGAIHADAARRWSVDGLAAVAGMSRSSFAERFAVRVGLSPMAYLAAWRLALAKDALLDPSRSVGEIALSVGYASTSAFSNAFRTAVGSSPARFRSTMG